MVIDDGLFKPAGGGPLLLDTFTRADNVLTLGNAETGQAAVPLAGTWGVVSNTAYCVADGGENAVVWDTGQANYDGTVTPVVVGSAGLVVRSNGTTNYLVYYQDGALYKTTNTGTNFAAVASGAAWGANTPIRVVAVGNTIQCYSGGVLRLTYTLTGSEITDFAGTYVGLFDTGATARFDDLTVVAA